MTKSLTEQWKDGTLEQKYYYVQFNCTPKPFVEIELKNFLLDLVKVKDRDTIEVLAPVPSYEEFIQQREFVAEHQNVLIENMNLKLKVEKLEQQLAEANEVLEEYASITGIPVCVAKQDIKNFNKKWGVK